MLESAIQHLIHFDLNSIGLFFGFIGALLLFFYGLPPMAALNEAAYVLSDTKAPKMKRSQLLSQLGFGLITAAFVCQFLAVGQG